jgi:fatty-acyl-CoA synthase
VMGQILSVAEVVAAHARLYPDKIGARDSRRSLTFRQWDERASRLANALHGLGLQQGDRAALLAYNCVEWMELYVGLARAGLVAVPINFRLVGSEIQYIAQHCQARAFVVQDDLLERVEGIRDQLDIPPERLIHFGAEAAPAGWTSYETLVEQGSASGATGAAH